MDYHPESFYLALLRDILANGYRGPDRTGVGTLKLWVRYLRFNLLKEGFPLLTTKRTWFRGILEELLWMIRGETNIRPLVLKKVNIWNDWPLKRHLILTGKEDVEPHSEAWNNEMAGFITRIKASEDFATQWGDLGPIYGWKWRHWQHHDGAVTDQLADVIRSIQVDPYSRRHLVIAYDPGEDIEKLALPPCHFEYAFNVEGEYLDIHMTMRSADAFLGLPFNIASYALLLMMVAQVTGLIAREVCITMENTHIYLNHIEAVLTQLNRNRTPYPFPTVTLNPSITNIDDFRPKDITLSGYKHHGTINADTAV